MAHGRAKAILDPVEAIQIGPLLIKFKILRSVVDRRAALDGFPYLQCRKTV